MKKLAAFAAVALIALIVSPLALAAQMKNPDHDQVKAPAPKASLGRLLVSEAQRNSGIPLIFVSASGQIISPAPTNADLWPEWEATQTWIGQNLNRINRNIDVWQSEYRANPTGTLVNFLNQKLQGHLAAINATTEIDRINRSMTHVNFSPAKGATSTLQAGLDNPEIQSNNRFPVSSCGPNGTCLNVVNCCVETCDPTGCSESCSVCDCDPGCAGCCGYGFKHLMVAD